MKDKWTVKPLMIQGIDTRTGKIYDDGFHVGFSGRGLVGILNEGTTKRHIIELKVINS